MGIIKQGILGGFSGKVGSVIGGSWKGRATMRSMPLSVANPRTTGQVNQRNRMTGCVDIAQRLLGLSIPILDAPFAGNISGYNRFVSRNTPAFTTAGVLIPADLKISEGALGNVTGLTVVMNESEEVGQLTYSGRAASPFNLDTDKVVVVGHNRNKGTWAVHSDTFDPNVSLEPVTMGFNTGAEASTGDIIDIWVAMIRVDKKYESGTAYKTTVTVA